MLMDYKESYELWLNAPYFDDATKQELESIKDDEKEIKERFHKALEFGTGGLRGIIGAGTNRMNIYTVRKATQGLSNFILKQEGNVKDMGVAIAYDSRRMSAEFADQAALVLCGNGIKTYVFGELHTVPELSFAVRHLGCIAGIVITASHNPPEYNGYKAYWSDGAQIPYPKDEAIIAEVEAVENFESILVADKDEAINSGLYNIIGEEVDAEFVKNVVAQTINKDVIDKMADKLTIVYTPLHGTGNKPVRRVLNELGYKNVHVVKEQELPDPNFSTISSPNPEDPKAFCLALELAKKHNADIIIGTDPDADRMGAFGAVKNSNGNYVILTGNMTGVLLTEYILSQKKAKNELPANGAVISTIVSTDMTKEIAKKYGVEYFEVLTGFKYIGEKMKQFEDTGSHEYLFGFEESYGCLAGTYARDKDAVLATMLICELAAYYKTRDMSLYEGLIELHEKYGYYTESIESITLKGIEGLENIKKIMASLRENPPKDICGINVVEVKDYASGVVKNMRTGEESSTGLPKSNVLYYVLEDGSWFCVRPSGTEPKIKVYFGTKADSGEAANEKNENLITATMKIINDII